MLYLLLKVLSAVGMGLVLKRADARSLDRLPLIRTNYAVAAVIGFFASVALNQTHISNQTALLAAVTGVLFVAGLLIWVRAIQAAGLALSIVAMRTAVVMVHRCRKRRQGYRRARDPGRTVDRGSTR